jgi:hypothetical protein
MSLVEEVFESLADKATGTLGKVSLKKKSVTFYSCRYAAGIEWLTGTEPVPAFAVRDGAGRGRGPQARRHIPPPAGCPRAARSENICFMRFFRYPPRERGLERRPHYPGAHLVVLARRSLACTLLITTEMATVLSGDGRNIRDLSEMRA